MGAAAGRNIPRLCYVSWRAAGGAWTRGARGGGGRETLRRGGAALGLFPGERFKAGTARLEPGDSLVLYTDGVVEPGDADQVEFGEERLEAAVRAAAGRPASEALRAVIEATQAFSGHDRYDDDFTLVVVKRNAAAG